MASAELAADACFTDTATGPPAPDPRGGGRGEARRHRPAGLPRRARHSVRPDLQLGRGGPLRLPARIVLPVGALASVVWVAAFVGGRVEAIVRDPELPWLVRVISVLALVGLGLLAALRMRAKHHADPDRD